MRSNTILIALALALSVTACKKQPPPDDALSIGATPAVEAPPSVNAPASVRAMAQNFQRVHFEFDSSTLGQEAKDALAANVEIMRNNPDLRVEVQGHCDERGTTEYNIALGDRRAAAVRDYMTRLGVSPSRLEAVSYGEERPLDYNRTEVAWSQNRRAEFRITWGSEEDGATGTVQ